MPQTSARSARPDRSRAIVAQEHALAQAAQRALECASSSRGAGQRVQHLGARERRRAPPSSRGELGVRREQPLREARKGDFPNGSDIYS